ncbi:MAG: hypothetical protein KKC77_19750 [Proteobacteria bacterium]|nr:hypothetical protein [Pseudomonadota bacterium]
MNFLGVFYDKITYKDGFMEISDKQFNKFVYSAGKAFNFILKSYFISGVRQPLSIIDPTIIDKAIPLTMPILGQIYHAFGDGNPSWDTNPEESHWYESTLTHEVYRKVPDYINYIKYGFGTASSGSASEIVDVRRFIGNTLVGRTEEDGFFVGQTVTIISGTNSGEARVIVDYEQQSGRIIVDTAFSAPIDITSSYEITPITTLSPSNYLEIKTTLPPGNISDPFNNKYLREHGLVIGNNNLLITKSNHTRVHKQVGNQLERFYRINLRF